VDLIHETEPQVRRFAYFFSELSRNSGRLANDPATFISVSQDNRNSRIKTMNFHAFFSLLRRASGTTTFRAVAVVLCLAVPLSVAAKRVWNSEHTDYVIAESDQQSLSRPRRPVQLEPRQKSRLQASVSIDADAFVYGSDPVKELLRQEDEETLSVVFVGQMFAPPAVAMAQRHMIDGAVNQHSDTLLHVACQSGNQLAVWLLIEAGASTTIKNRFEETPLDVAIRTDAPSETSITAMIRQRLIPTPLMADPTAHQG